MLCCFFRPTFPTKQAIDGAAKQSVGKEGQNYSGPDGAAPKPKSMEDEELENQVENESSDEHFANRFPGAEKTLASMLRAVEQVPKVGRLAFFRVFFAVAEGEVGGH